MPHSYYKAYCKKYLILYTWNLATKMALRVQVDDSFDSRENFSGQIEEGLANGWKNFIVLANGELVNSENYVKASLGPVVGEVTTDKANIILEVLHKLEGKRIHVILHHM